MGIQYFDRFRMILYGNRKEGRKEGRREKNKGEARVIKGGTKRIAKEGTEVSIRRAMINRRNMR